MKRPQPLKPKVTAAAGGATAGTVIAGFVLYLLSVWPYAGDVPMPVQAFVWWLATTGLATIAGYLQADGEHRAT